MTEKIHEHIKAALEHLKHAESEYYALHRPLGVRSEADRLLLVALDALEQYQKYVDLADEAAVGRRFKHTATYNSKTKEFEYGGR